MAGKKKVKKKSKKSKEANPDEENKEENLAPEYIDPKLAYPEVDIEIKLATPPNIEELSKHSSNSRWKRELLEILFILTDNVALNYKLRTSTRLTTILQHIIDSHDGAIKSEDISMCLDHYSS